jgi:hypothetical protein
MNKPLSNFSYFILSISLITLSSCANLSKKPEEFKLPPEYTEPEGFDAKEKCICVQLWLPVCGENGKTYSNACFAKCAGVKYTQGSCTQQGLE